jgi:enoyl-CoA hydratase
MAGSVVSGVVSYELEESVAVVRMDDGKANALAPDLVAAVDEALDRAEKEARCVVIAGRPGRFSAGFDLSVMGEGGDAVRRMVTAGAELAFRLYGFPTPVVMACTGHALAMGAVLLLAGDTRLGAEGEFKIGLNEVAIGMTLPVFAVELARDRLSRGHLTRAVLEAEIYSPVTAVEAGFLDRVVAPDALFDEARAEARRLAELDLRAHHSTKLNLRGRAIQHMRDSVSR